MTFTSSAPRIFYKLDGFGGPKILFITGFGFPHSACNSQVEGLRATHQLLTFDAPGVGQSENTPFFRRIQMGHHVTEIIRLLDDVRWQGVHVVGVSMGGMIAQELVISNATRFRSLTLIASSAGGPFHWIPPRKGIEQIIKSELARNEDRRIEALNTLLYTEDFLANVPEAEMKKRIEYTVLTRPPTSVLLSQFLSIVFHDTRKSLRNLRKPTLIVAPQVDNMVASKRSDVIKKLVPHAELLILENAGHGCVFQERERINEKLAAFTLRADKLYKD